MYESKKVCPDLCGATSEFRPGYGRKNNRLDSPEDTVKRTDASPDIPYAKIFNEVVEDKNDKWNKIVSLLESTYGLPKNVLGEDYFRTSLRKMAPDIFEAADMLEAVVGVIRQTNDAASKDDFPYKAKPDTIPTPLQNPQ